MGLAWPARWGLRMQRETSSGGEMAVLCETNLPLPRQLPNPVCLRGENSVLAVHLSALLLCLVQVRKGTQRCSCSPALLSCRKRPKEIQKPGKERLCASKVLSDPSVSGRGIFCWCYRVSWKSLGRDVPAEEDLCSEEKQELCCFQTVLGPGGTWFCIWLETLCFTPFEFYFWVWVWASKFSKIRSCKTRFPLQLVPRKAVTQKRLALWRGQLLKLTRCLSGP